MNKLTSENRKEIFATRTGTIHSDETKIKISTSQKGKILSEEHRLKLCKPKSPEHKAKLQGINNGMYGKRYSPKIVTCPHCGKVGSIVPMNRWHFNKCKFR